MPLGWSALDSNLKRSGGTPHTIMEYAGLAINDRRPRYAPLQEPGPATAVCEHDTVCERARLLRCLNCSLFQVLGPARAGPAEAPNSRKAAFAQPSAGSHRASLAPLAPPAVVRFRVRVLQTPAHRAAVLGPAPPKGRVAYCGPAARVADDLSRGSAMLGRWKSPRGSADALVPRA